MSLEKKILAVIPARGGSKGLPGKNIKEFCGKPLIAYAIDVLKKSKYAIDVYISTDSEKIETVGKVYGVETVMRPAELSTDTALVGDAIKYTIAYLGKRGKVYDAVLLIEATSPLRTVKDVDDSLDLYFKEDDTDCLATFSMLEHPVTRLWKIKGNVPYVFIDRANPFLPRQQQEYGYYINGLVYVFNARTLMENQTNSLFIGKQIALVTEHPVIDIDNALDFFMAEQLFKYLKNENN